MHEEKARVRAEVRAAVGAMSAAIRTAASARICEALTRTEAYDRARCVLGYLAIGDEPDLGALMESARADGKRVCLPRVAGDRLEIVEATAGEVELIKSPLGVLEPSAGRVVAPKELDLLVIPGVAFDIEGGRLGRGKGFFDRLLACPERHWMVCGVCFGAAVVDAVPVAPHDARVDAVATERWVVGNRIESEGLWRTGAPDR
jgi:5-formyltetrahydrofolate cyclo-ligase